jgi:8-amino-7-oxononanoate synthase
MTRLRSLKPRAGIDFSSNDYLALASAPRMRKALSAAVDAGTPIGAGFATNAVCTKECFCEIG